MLVIAANHLILKYKSFQPTRLQTTTQHACLLSIQRVIVHNQAQHLALAVLPQQIRQQAVETGADFIHRVDYFFPPCAGHEEQGKQQKTSCDEGTQEAAVAASCLLGASYRELDLFNSLLWLHLHLDCAYQTQLVADNSESAVAEESGGRGSFFFDSGLVMFCWVAALILDEGRATRLREIPALISRILSATSAAIPPAHIQQLLAIYSYCSNWSNKIR